MGCIYIGINDYESAEKYLEKAYNYFHSQNSLDDDYAFVTYAICLAKLGKYLEANKIGDYLLETLGVEGLCLIDILTIYYYTNNYEKIRCYTDVLLREWAIQEDVLAIIMSAYKDKYSAEEYERRYIDIIQRVKKGYRPAGWKKKDYGLLEKVYKQIDLGIKPEIKRKLLPYFESYYIE